MLSNEGVNVPSVTATKPTEGVARPKDREGRPPRELLSLSPRRIGAFEAGRLVQEMPHLVNECRAVTLGPLSGRKHDPPAAANALDAAAAAGLPVANVQPKAVRDAPRVWKRHSQPIKQLCRDTFALLDAHGGPTDRAPSD